MTEWLLLSFALVLVAANAVFVAAEFSLVAVDHAAVERAVRGKVRGAAGVLRARRSLSTQLSGAQLGITVTSLLIGFIAEPSLAALLTGPLGLAGLPPGAMTAVSVILALAIATIFQMIFGELVPKNLAIARPMPTARAVTPLQRGFTAAARPLITVLNGAANRLLRLMGIEPQEELQSARSARELASLVRRSAQQGTLPRPTAQLLTRTLAFGDRTAQDVMTPRRRVHFLPADQPVRRILDAAEATGHSRFPVIDQGDVDDVVGFVHVKHALAVPLPARATTPLRQVMVAPLRVPASLELDPLLTQLRQHGLQMAVVIDEFGGTDGVVTLEDLVEELVGDIADEHDRPGAHARRRGDGGWSLSGLLRLDEAAALTGLPFAEDEHYDTLAGLVLHHLGRMPTVGDRVTETVGQQPVELVVERMDGLRIDRVRLQTLPGDPEPGGQQ
ncbi:HlyC/CorC family transporter [Natronosporangium hydrolyticum]|uniref:HlyC/CorC family transporter n=1 Tax=Natronosporangium hydrolyticum TaxID=2811111 RepID=A0A895YH62_9ACTN|nr:hemolysin family protein [Natronosporangium hydrolyticum]QSB15395.1 HlyC/CorC family transporter [Natronosporangium hydrolyticum]